MTTAGHINGVNRDQYGVWCEHDLRVMIPDPGDTRPVPACIPAEPWPCDPCTLADLQREEAEIAALREEAESTEHREMTT